MGLLNAVYLYVGVISVLICFVNIVRIEACNEGWYGTNCTQKCGHCAGVQLCDVTNGHCNACDGDFTMPLCADDSGISSDNDGGSASAPREWFEISTAAQGGIIGGILGVSVILLASLGIYMRIFPKRPGQNIERLGDTDHSVPATEMSRGSQELTPKQGAEPISNDNSPADIVVHHVDDGNYDNPKGVSASLQSSDVGRVNPGTDCYENPNDVYSEVGRVNSGADCYENPNDMSAVPQTSDVGRVNSGADCYYNPNDVSAVPQTSDVGRVNPGADCYYNPNDVSSPQTSDMGRVNSAADYYEIGDIARGEGSYASNTSNYDSLNPTDIGRRNEYEMMQRGKSAGLVYANENL